MNLLNENVSKYLDSFYEFEEGLLGEIQKSALSENIPIIPKDTVTFITTILSIKKPKNILEIGTAVGFSASLFTYYLDEGGEITTIEKNPLMAEKAKLNFKKLGIENKINLLTGDANEILKIIDTSFDVVFMDAAKGQYIKILPYCLKLLKTGGILIADDVLQKGAVAFDNVNLVEKRNRTIYKRMRGFLNELSQIEELKTTIVPVGDGVALCYKIKEKENF